MRERPKRTPLEDWIRDRIGLGGGHGLTPDVLSRYQVARLREVIRTVRRKSPFYRELLGGLPDDFPDAPEDMARAPFTTEADIRERHRDMLCVSHGDVSRVVTLKTSGSTALPKRLYFTERDLDLTVDFFHHGMTTLVRPGARVLILMPGQAPGSVGDLLDKALGRMNAQGFVHGVVTDRNRAIHDLVAHRAECLVGLPVQVLGLARHPGSREIPRGLVKSVLLSADFVPRAIVRELESCWGAKVFEHYGTTEMGLGGGVQCEAREGYHVREADLFLEVVDPASGCPMPRGETGEVVLTTLTREGMPLIRYRTGDLARFLLGPCACGSSLRRLGTVEGRVSGRVALEGGGTLGLPEMDEVLFGIPGVLNYQAELNRRDGLAFLDVRVDAVDRDWSGMPSVLARGLMEIPSVRKAFSLGRLRLGPVSRGTTDRPSDGMTKRMLQDNRLRTG